MKGACVPSMLTLFLYKVDLGPHAQAMESSPVKPADPGPSKPQGTQQPPEAAEPVKSQAAPQPAEPAVPEVKPQGSQHRPKPTVQPQGAEKPNEPAGPPPVQALTSGWTKVDPLTEAINDSTAAGSSSGQSWCDMTCGYDEYGTWWERDGYDDKLWWFKKNHESWRRWRDQSAPWLLVLFCCFVSLMDLVV